MKYFVELYLGIDAVGLLKQLQNMTLQPLPWNTYRVIVHIVQNNCYRYMYFSLTVRGWGLKLLPMSPVHLVAPSISLYWKGPRSRSCSYCPWTFQTFNKIINNFHHRYIETFEMEASTLTNQNEVMTKGESHLTVLVLINLKNGWHIVIFIFHVSWYIKSSSWM